MFAKKLSLIGLSGLISLTMPLAQIFADDGEVSLQGLQLVEKDRSSSLYADPNVDWSTYSEIQLLDATVAFRKNWQRDQNRSDPFKVKTEDMEKIKASLSEMFGEVFSQELTENGDYKMSATAGENVLLIKPSIVDLDVAAPDTMRSGMNRQYTESTGKMTLKLELMDSVTGDLLASSSDRREAPRRGYLQWTTSVTNQAEARRMLQTWAADLRKRLDQARTTGMTDAP